MHKVVSKLSIEPLFLWLHLGLGVVFDMLTNSFHGWKG